MDDIDLVSHEHRLSAQEKISADQVVHSLGQPVENIWGGTTRMVPLSI